MNLLQKNLCVCFKVSNAIGVAMEMEKRIRFCDRWEGMERTHWILRWKCKNALNFAIKCQNTENWPKNLQKGVSFKEHMRRHEMNALVFAIEMQKRIRFCDKKS